MVEELVMERFRVLARIGSGGMGTVYRAYDERLQRLVALKEIQAAHPERILREAQAAARLNHPAIVTLYELGKHDGRAVLVSELVPGETLAALGPTGALCDRDVAEITADLCDALAHAHARGVVHRDLKPENVIIADDPRAGRRAKLMDFGIARIAGAPTLTAAGEVVGTLAYMSPEQADGELAGPETDVYSLALTAYECWAGINPVAGRTPAETARRIGLGVPGLRHHRPDLPRELADTIDACLESNPTIRPTPQELRACLDSELGLLDDVHALPGSTQRPDDSERPSVDRFRIVVLAGIALSLVALATLGLPGLAVVLAVILAPAALAGAPAAALAPAAAPLLAAGGIGAAGAGLGALATAPIARAALGAGAWAWLLMGSLTLGIGPDIGIAPPAPDGWATGAGVAADHLLGPLIEPESLLAASLFAIASAALGWLLTARHASIALLGAMVWAAGVDATLSLVGDGSLGGEPVAVIVAATAAVVIEFALIRPRAAAVEHAATPRDGRDVGRGPLPQGLG